MSKPHAILSDLHRLLSTYQSDDILAASRYPGLPSSLKDALVSLAREARLADERYVDHEGIRQEIGPIRRRPAGSRSTTPIEGSVPATAELILRSEYGASNASMLDFARKYGLKLDTRSKESRERVAKRLASLIQDLPEMKRNQASTSLVERTDSQTEGWINVIRRSKR